MWPHRFRFCVFKEYLLKLILRRYIVSLVFRDSSIHNFESLVKGISDDMWSFKVMDEKKTLIIPSIGSEKWCSLFTHFWQNSYFPVTNFIWWAELLRQHGRLAKDDWTPMQTSIPKLPVHLENTPEKKGGKHWTKAPPIFVGLLCYITFCALVFDMQND